jgi:hypothetical protein
MAIEEQMVDAFNKILNYQHINEVIGDWQVSNVMCPTLVELWYKGDAIYGFGVSIAGDFVRFYNYHREAKKGTGTLSLKQLESSFVALAANRNQPVISIFKLCGQKDTEAWLKKNGYVSNTFDVYHKLIEVPKEVPHEVLQ